MADEEKKDDAAAAAPPPVSFVQKLLKPPLVIVLAVVIGVGAAFGVMKFMGPKSGGHAVEGEAEAGGDGGHGSGESDGGHGGGHGSAETKAIDKAAHGAPDKVAGEHAPKDSHGGEGAPAENTYKLEPFVVNIMEKNSIHYLKLTFEVETTSPAVIEEIKSKTALLRDSILYIVSDMTMREIVTMGGKTLLKEEIITHFNRQLKSGKIERLYFTDFTIQ